MYIRHLTFTDVFMYKYIRLTKGVHCEHANNASVTSTGNAFYMHEICATFNILKVTMHIFISNLKNRTFLIL